MSGSKWKITFIDGTVEFLEYGELKVSVNGAFLHYSHSGSYWSDHKATYVIANVQKWEPVS